MDPRLSADAARVRAARNQSLYREVNEKIEDMNAAFEDDLSVAAVWICECLSACSGRMEMTLREYESVRAHPNHFAVLRGHDDQRVEHVVEDHDNYIVVAKLGLGAAFAIQHDPRG